MKTYKWGGSPSNLSPAKMSSEEKDSIITMSSQDSIPTRPLKNKKYNCEDCRLSTDSLAHFKRHQFVHLPFFEKAQKKRFMCPWCPHKTNRRHDMKRHRQICKGRSNRVHLPYVLVCRGCPFEDDDPATVKRHEMEAHGLHKEDHNLFCGLDECTYKTNDEVNLLNHIKQIHVYGLNIPCNICGVHCSSYPKLQEHIQKCHVM